MQPNPEFPYPTFVELIRAFAGALDIKQSHKVLDDKAYDRCIDPRKTDQLIDQSLYKPLMKLVGERASDLILTHFQSMIKDYARMIGSVSADGITREKMLPVLLQGFFKDRFAHLLIEIHRVVGGPEPITLVGSHDTAVDVILCWIIKHEPSWEGYLRSLNKIKERRDRLSAWRRGDEIPASQSIKLLKDWSEKPAYDQINWERLQTLMMLARGIEVFKRNELSANFLNAVRHSLLGDEQSIDVAAAAQQLQIHYQANIGNWISDIAFIQHRLLRTAPKHADDRNKLKQCIDHCRKQLAKVSFGFHTTYWLDWHDARWHLLSGQLDQASDFYKKAFYGCLFRAGENQYEIIKEALIVAAHQRRPDKVFLKHLKWASLTFSYDLPSVTTSEPSNKFFDSVEEWEIEMWKAQFARVFPAQGFFPGYLIDLPLPRIGPLICANPEAIKPDTELLDKIISVGDTWQKKLPQLVWFIDLDNFAAVQQLITAGATVNCASDVGDTPVLMALEAMNVTELPPRSMDERFFELVSSFEHDSEIINMRTQKKRLLPIISAVQTGRLTIVEKVLKLGADTNGRGETDEQTPLNVCMKYIGILKNPERYIDVQKAMPKTPEVLDSIRRYLAGAAGHTLKDQQEFLHQATSNEIAIKLKELYFKLVTERICQHMRLDELRLIARRLIEAGADVNAEHRSPQPGHTPLMLAAEHDERKLFEIMLINGGDPKKKFRDRAFNQDLDCWSIAKIFGARDVQFLLQDIQRAF
tara:strand:+ start:521 stop:2785 length:2265 start_codon:yes stop_codon:yes gene_type:complete